MLAMLFVSACSGSDSSSPIPQSPTAPSNPTAPSGGATAGATVNGMVAPSSTAASTTMSPRVLDMTAVATVQVVGTNVSSAVDGTGRFALAGVPAGSVQLRFSGPGTDATTTVNNLAAGQTVAIVVVVSGTQATVIADSRQPSSEIPINGNLSGLTGSAAAFEFTIEGRIVRGDASTQFFGDGNRVDSFSNLLNGARVEVKALARDGFFYAVRIHINRDQTAPAPTPPAPAPTPPGQQESASIEGPLTSLSGGLPNLVLVVGGTTVRTSASTDVQRRGDKQDLSALRTGQTLHVVGVRQGDGSIDARQLQIKDDAPSGEFEIEGSMGGLRGTCPSLTFKVNGFSIATTSATSFPTDGCSSFKNGDKVRVRGLRQADESVIATEVARR
jgi:hypothetical protein